MMIMIKATLVQRILLLCSVVSSATGPSSAASSKSSSATATPANITVNGCTYTALNKTLFVNRQNGTNLPVNATAAQRNAIAAAAGGPGSINRVCVDTFCPVHQSSCLNNNECLSAVNCVKSCGDAYNLAAKNTSIDIQKQNWNCVNQSYFQSHSAQFNALSLCAQQNGCISKYKPVFAPVPTYIAAAPLSSLFGNWTIGAGINPGYDRFNNSKLRIFTNGTARFRWRIADPSSNNNGTLKRHMVGNLTNLSDGIYYFRALTVEGFWYNLGSSADSDMVIVYYTAKNYLSNWFGGYILLKNKKIFDQNAQTEAAGLLAQAFAVPPAITSNGAIRNLLVADWATCTDPSVDTCMSATSKGYVCCQNSSNQQFTCRPNSLSHCVAYSASTSPTLEALPFNSTSWNANNITLHDFKILSSS